MLVRLFLPQMSTKIDVSIINSHCSVDNVKRLSLNDNYQVYEVAATLICYVRMFTIFLA